jgi:hypothetical protein
MILFKHYSGPWSHTGGIMINIHTGGYNETEKNAGITHLGEHGMFMGTKNMSHEDLQTKLAIFFDHVEARTSGECVQLFCYFKIKNFDIVLEILSEMLFSWKFINKNFEEEKKDLVNEYNNYFESDVYKLRFSILSEIGFSTRSVLGEFDFAKNLINNDIIRSHLYWKKILKIYQRSVVTIGKLTHEQNQKIQNIFCKKGVDKSIIKRDLYFSYFLKKGLYILLFSYKEKHIHFSLLYRIFHYRCMKKNIFYNYNFFQMHSLAVYSISDMDTKISHSILSLQITKEDFK